MALSRSIMDLITFRVRCPDKAVFEFHPHIFRRSIHRLLRHFLEIVAAELVVAKAGLSVLTDYVNRTLSLTSDTQSSPVGLVFTPLRNVIFLVRAHVYWTCSVVGWN